MSTELVPLGDLPVGKYDDTFADVASSSAYLPYIQLYGGNSKLCKQGKIPIGHFGVVRNKEVQPLGQSFDCIPLAYRPRAMDTSSDDMITVFNPQSELFKEIQAKSEIKDSGCMFGPEFLLWVPSLEIFSVFFMSSKTARRASPEVKALIGKAATIRSQFIETKQYSWHGPQTIACSTPLKLPSQEETIEHVTRFKNPPEKEVEKAPEGGTER